MKVNTLFIALLLLSVMLPLTESTILGLFGKTKSGSSKGNGHDKDSSKSSKGGYGHSNSRDSDSNSRSGSKPYQPPVVTTPIIRPPVIVAPPTIPPVVVSPPAWSIINNFRNDQQVVLAINYLTTTYTIFRTVTIVQVSRQVYNGNRYRFLVQYPYTSSFNTRTEITLHQSLTGVYSLVGNSFIGLPAFNSAQLIAQPYNNVQYFSDVNRLLQRNLGTRLGVNPSVLNVSVQYPYYSVSYLCDQNRSVQASLSYDPIFGRLNVFDVKENPYRKW